MNIKNKKNCREPSTKFFSLEESCKEIFFLARFLQDVLQKNALSCKTLKENLARSLQGTHFFSTRMKANRAESIPVLSGRLVNQTDSNLFCFVSVLIEEAVRLLEVFFAVEGEPDLVDLVNDEEFSGQVIKTVDGIFSRDPESCFKSAKAKGGEVTFDIPRSSVTHVNVLKPAGISSEW